MASPSTPSPMNPLWLLLRHEFRLRQRYSSWNLQSNLIACLIFSIFLAIAVIVICQLSLQVKGYIPVLDLSLQKLPPYAPMFAGGLFYFAVYIGLTTALLHQKNLGDRYQYILPHTSPVFTRTVLASYILNDIWANSLLINLWLLPFSVALAYFCRTVFVIVHLHLMATAITVIGCTISIWWTYICVKWRRNKAFQFFNQFCFLFLYGGYCLLFFGLPFLEGKNLFPREIFIQIENLKKSLVAQGGWFGPESWFWVPGRAVLLDPLPAIGLITISIGLVWLTLQKLPCSLFQLLQAMPTAKLLQKPVKIEKVQFKQQNLIQVLLLKEWRLLGWRKQTWIVHVLGLPCISGMLLISGSTLEKDPFLVIVCLIVLPTFYSLIFALGAFGREGNAVLLKTAPIHSEMIWAGKYLAILLPIWGLNIPVAVSLGLMGYPWGWMVLFLAMAPTCGVLLRSWNTLPITAGNSLSNFELEQSGIRDIKLLIWCELMSLLLWWHGANWILKGQILEGLGLLCLEVCVMVLAYWRSRRLPNVLGF
ncbi:MAG: hypothetical protein WCD18_15635 [Thermosynechococcaceae cyanobacterium]